MKRDRRADLRASLPLLLALCLAGVSHAASAQSPTGASPRAAELAAQNAFQRELRELGGELRAALADRDDARVAALVTQARQRIAAKNAGIFFYAFSREIASQLMTKEPEAAFSLLEEFNKKGETPGRTGVALEETRLFTSRLDELQTSRETSASFESAEADATRLIDAFFQNARRNRYLARECQKVSNRLLKTSPGRSGEALRIYIAEARKLGELGDQELARLEGIAAIRERLAPQTDPGAAAKEDSLLERKPILNKM